MPNKQIKPPIAWFFNPKFPVFSCLQERNGDTHHHRVEELLFRGELNYVVRHRLWHNQYLGSDF